MKLLNSNILVLTCYSLIAIDLLYAERLETDLARNGESKNFAEKRNETKSNKNRPHFRRTLAVKDTQNKQEKLELLSITNLQKIKNKPVSSLYFNEHFNPFKNKKLFKRIRRHNKVVSQISHKKLSITFDPNKDNDTLNSFAKFKRDTTRQETRNYHSSEIGGHFQPSIESERNKIDVNLTNVHNKEKFKTQSLNIELEHNNREDITHKHLVRAQKARDLKEKQHIAETMLKYLKVDNVLHRIMDTLKNKASMSELTTVEMLRELMAIVSLMYEEHKEMRNANEMVQDQLSAHQVAIKETQKNLKNTQIQVFNILESVQVIPSYNTHLSMRNKHKKPLRKFSSVQNKNNNCFCKQKFCKFCKNLDWKKQKKNNIIYEYETKRVLFNNSKEHTKDRKKRSDKNLDKEDTTQDIGSSDNMGKIVDVLFSSKEQSKHVSDTILADANANKYVEMVSNFTTKITKAESHLRVDQHLNNKLTLIDLVNDADKLNERNVSTDLYSGNETDTMIALHASSYVKNKLIDTLDSSNETLPFSSTPALTFSASTTLVSLSKTNGDLSTNFSYAANHTTIVADHISLSVISNNDTHLAENSTDYDDGIEKFNDLNDKERITRNTTESDTTFSFFNETSGVLNRTLIIPDLDKLNDIPIVNKSEASNMTLDMNVYSTQNETYENISSSTNFSDDNYTVEHHNTDMKFMNLASGEPLLEINLTLRASTINEIISTIRDQQQLNYSLMPNMSFHDKDDEWAKHPVNSINQSGDSIMLANDTIVLGNDTIIVANDTITNVSIILTNDSIKLAYDTNIDKINDNISPSSSKTHSHTTTKETILSNNRNNSFSYIINITSNDSFSILNSSNIDNTINNASISSSNDTINLEEEDLTASPKNNFSRAPLNISDGLRANNTDDNQMNVSSFVNQLTLPNLSSSVKTKMADVLISIIHSKNEPNTYVNESLTKSLNPSSDLSNTTFSYSSLNNNSSIKSLKDLGLSNIIERIQKLEEIVIELSATNANISQAKMEQEKKSTNILALLMEQKSLADTLKEELRKHKVECAGLRSNVTQQLQQSLLAQNEMKNKTAKLFLDMRHQYTAVQHLHGYVTKTSAMVTKLTSQVSSINIKEFIVNLRESVSNLTKDVLSVDQWRSSLQEIEFNTTENKARTEWVSAVTKLEEKLTTKHNASQRLIRHLQGHVINLNNSLQDMTEKVSDLNHQGHKEKPGITGDKMKNLVDSLQIQLLFNTNRLSQLEATRLNYSLIHCGKSRDDLEQEVKLRHLEEQVKFNRKEVLQLQEKIKQMDNTVSRLQGQGKVTESRVAQLLRNVPVTLYVMSHMTNLKTDLDNIMISLPKDCHGYFTKGHLHNGTYVIYVTDSVIHRTVKVYCVMMSGNSSPTELETNTNVIHNDIHPLPNDKSNRPAAHLGDQNDYHDANKGGWTVIQKRSKGQVNFSRSWDDYSRGFGDSASDFWAGNDAIYSITRDRIHELWIITEDIHSQCWEARYTSFQMGAKEDNYRLHIGGYHGNATDALRYANNVAFSTVDRDNDDSSTHCAQYNGGGWWYSQCHITNLNGPHQVGMAWYHVERKDWIHLKSSLMMIRQRDIRYNTAT